MRASRDDGQIVSSTIATRVHTHDFEMESITLTTARSVGSRACTHVRTRKKARSHSQRREAKDAGDDQTTML